MPFVQVKLDRSVLQTRDIFNKYVYEPGNGDTLADVTAAGYFNESRYRGNPGWENGIIEANVADGYYILQLDNSGSNVTTTVVGGGGAALTPEEMADAFDVLLDNRHWREGPNSVYVIDEQDMINQGLLQPANADYPNGFYQVPAGKRLVLDRVVDHSLPIELNGVPFVEGLLGLGSGLNYTGGLGNGPVTLGEDAGLVVRGSAGTSFNNMVVQNFSGTTGILSDGAGFGVSGVVFLALKAMSLIGNSSDFFSSARNFVFFQSTPSTITLGAGETITASFDNFFVANTGPLGITGDFMDLTGADPGTLNITGAGNTTDMTAPNAMFLVTDDNTIDSGLFTNNRQSTSMIAEFIRGIDEKALNTVFAGNNFENTLRKGAILMNGNATATPNAGAGVYSKALGTFEESDTVSGWEMDVNGRLTYIDPNTDFEGDFVLSASIGKIGGGSNDLQVAVYKNGLAPLDDGLATAETDPLTVESGDFVSAPITFPVIATFGDYYEIWVNVDSNNDDPILRSAQLVVS